MIYVAKQLGSIDNTPEVLVSLNFSQLHLRNRSPITKSSPITCGPPTRSSYNVLLTYLHVKVPLNLGRIL